MDTQTVVRRVRERAETRPRRVRVAAAAALTVAVVLVLARTNPMHLTFLQDHPLSGNWAFGTASLLMVLALELFSWTVGRLAAVLVSVVVIALICGGGFFLESPASFVRRGHDLAGDAYTADGRYELRIYSWDYADGPSEWQVLVERRGTFRFVATDAGCLAASATTYQGIASFEPGRARLTTSDGTVDIRFDPDTMRVTTPIPAALCPKG
ncbi:hypothetical protein [Actinoplanes sp. NPDC051851]|uniref:hypothetical protein n=1 Tax=Actinoplanes sp. NPDC051851 TaxID=3154753 RepID=UPI00344A1DAA